jgi:glycosyltransferase involved in cell wall biosynthesis
MLKVREVPVKPTILSPRGEFSPGALVIHNFRKIVYLRIASAVGLLRDVWLHATAEHEVEDVRRAFPGSRGILFAPDASRPIKFGGHSSIRGAASSKLRLAFLGRVTPVKNLHYALEVLRRVTTEVEFHIYGPIESCSYWANCKQIIAGMPDNVVVGYLGEIPNDTVPDVLKNYDLFFLPTRGENFGHAIYEALASGVPVLISDQTIWRDLEHQEAGWSLSLKEPERFAAVIDWYAAVGDDQRRRLRLGAKRLAERVLVESDFVNKYRQMLNVLLERDAS